MVWKICFHLAFIHTFKYPKESLIFRVSLQTFSLYCCGASSTWSLQKTPWALCLQRPMKSSIFISQCFSPQLKALPSFEINGWVTRNGIHKPACRERDSEDIFLTQFQGRNQFKCLPLLFPHVCLPCQKKKKEKRNVKTRISASPSVQLNSSLVWSDIRVHSAAQLIALQR